MDIMEVRKDASFVVYTTRNTVRTWRIDLKVVSTVKTSGEPAKWQYTIYDDENLIAAVGKISGRREEALAGACGVVEELDRYEETNSLMDEMSENLNPPVKRSK